jgi:hypothetical protein
MRDDADVLLIAEGEEPGNLFDRAWSHHRERAAVKELPVVNEKRFDIDGIRKYQARLA